MASTAKNSETRKPNYVSVFGCNHDTRNIFPMTQGEIVAAILAISESEDAEDIYLATRLRKALSYLRRYNDKTQEPIIVLKLVVTREATRKRLYKLHPNDDYEND